MSEPTREAYMRPHIREQFELTKTRTAHTATPSIDHVSLTQQHHHTPFLQHAPTTTRTYHVTMTGRKRRDLLVTFTSFSVLKQYRNALARYNRAHKLSTDTVYRGRHLTGIVTELRAALRTAELPVDGDRLTFSLAEINRVVALVSSRQASKRLPAPEDAFSDLRIEELALAQRDREEKEEESEKEDSDEEKEQGAAVSAQLHTTRNPNVIALNRQLINIRAEYFDMRAELVDMRAEYDDTLNRKLADMRAEFDDTLNRKLADVRAEVRAEYDQTLTGMRAWFWGRVEEEEQEAAEQQQEAEGDEPDLAAVVAAGGYEPELGAEEQAQEAEGDAPAAPGDDDICPQCDTRIGDDMAGVQCNGDDCGAWWHCPCVPITPEEAEQTTWFCRQCAQGETEALCPHCNKACEDDSVRCDRRRCKLWWHYACVGITADEAQELEEWFCPKHEPRRSSKRKRA